MCFTDHHMCSHIETHTHIQIISTFNSSAKESWEWQSVTSQLYSTLQFTFWPLWSSGQPSEVDSTGIMINPILQMWKVRLRGVNIGLYFSVDSAELGWGSCLAQCCFITDSLVQTEMCRDSGSTLWSWVSVVLEQTGSRTVNSNLNAMPPNGMSAEMEPLLDRSCVGTYNKRLFSISVLSCFKVTSGLWKNTRYIPPTRVGFPGTVVVHAKVTRLTVLFLTEMEMNEFRSGVPSSCGHQPG